MIWAVSTLLIVSLTINILMVWYVRRLLVNFYAVSENFESFYAMIASYADHLENQRIYRLMNQEKVLRCNRIANWKRRGLIETDYYTYDSLYEIYLTHTNCELCNVELTVDKKRTKTTKCMDHDHSTGIFRFILCQCCNGGLR